MRVVDAALRFLMDLELRTPRLPYPEVKSSLHDSVVQRTFMNAAK
jgi:hypothetical protein